MERPLILPMHTRRPAANICSPNFLSHPSSRVSIPATIQSPRLASPFQPHIVGPVRHTRPYMLARNMSCWMVHRALWWVLPFLSSYTAFVLILRTGRLYCPVHVRGALVQRHTFSVIRSPRHAPQFDVVEFVGLCAVRRRVGGRGDLFLLSCLRALCIAFAGSPARLIGVVEAASVTFLIINAFQLQYATLNGRTFNRIYA